MEETDSGIAPDAADDPQHPDRLRPFRHPRYRKYFRHYRVAGIAINRYVGT
jgi:hypothetical protein